jgi:hypothetical protein
MIYLCILPNLIPFTIYTDTYKHLKSVQQHQESKFESLIKKIHLKITNISYNKYGSSVSRHKPQMVQAKPR